MPLVITGEQIKAARQRAGLTQGELGQKVGVSLRTIGNWERGVSSPVGHEARLRDVLRDHLDDAGTPPPLESVSDVALLAEIARRLALASEKAGEGNGNPAPNTPAGESPASNVHALNREDQDPDMDARVAELLAGPHAARRGVPDHLPDDTTGEEPQVGPEDDEQA